MAGTNAHVAKRALVNLLSAAPALTGVQVTYAFAGDSLREAIYLGKATWDTEPLAFRAGARMKRKEDLTVELYLRVMVPGGEPSAAEARVVELGTVAEELIATDTTLSGATGLRMAQVRGGEMDHWTNDDGVIAGLMYRVDFLSELT
jgi:hypothetical protein